MSLTLLNADAVLTSAAASIIAAGPASQLLILKASVCNTDAAARTVTVHRVNAGHTAAATTEVIQALSVAAGATAVLPLSGQTIINGQSLQALASTGGVVNINISYVQA